MLFTMRKTRWTEGLPVKVYVLADDNPVHVEFVKQSLQLYPRQLRRVWNRRTYSGSGQPPVEVSSLEEMLSQVRRQPGAVGYLPADMLGDEIKVLEVER